ncbi:MAG TPA: DUF4157 domain-containing protein [Steroidobacteraceae bacterium]|nr:DUF4157 domain-containing protein [Steroidobacteraceae bacterium]
MSGGFTSGFINDIHHDGPAAVPIRTPSLPLQRKLAIGTSCDPLEAQADLAAEAATGRVAHRPQPRQQSFATPQLTEAPLLVHQVLRSSGQELPTDTRGWAESVFQRDFSRVRIHHGEEAKASAASINARAYTVGSRIVFGHNIPSSGSGYRSLLAHELAHVTQQGAAPVLQDARVRASVPEIAPRVQREEEAPTAPKDLGILWETAISAMSAPAKLYGDTVYNVVRATWHGFVSAIKDGAGDAYEKVKAHAREFATSPSQILLFFPKYWLGLLEGFASPLIGLFNLGKFVLQMSYVAGGLLATTWLNREKLARDAEALGARMAAMGGKAADAVQGLFSNPKAALSGLASIIERANQKIIAGAEGAGEDIAKSLLKSTDKPIPDLAKAAGEAIGTIVVNILLLIFSDGIGNAISKIASMLGELASGLSKLGEAAKFLGGIAVKVFEVLGTVGKWITGVEEFIAKAASTILKPLEPVLREFGNVMGDLRTFLRDLLGVAEKEAGQEAAAAGKVLGGDSPKIPAEPLAPPTKSVASPPAANELAPPSLHEPAPHPAQPSLAREAPPPTTAQDLKAPTPVVEKPAAPSQATKPAPKPKPAAAAEAPKPKPKSKPAPSESRQKYTESLDKRIAENPDRLNEARAKTVEYKEMRQAAGRSQKGGPIKGIYNAKEDLHVLLKARARPGTTVYEQVRLLGVGNAEGELTSAISGEGRILDFLQEDGSKFVGGEIKSGSEIVKSVEDLGGPGTAGKFKQTSKVGGQLSKEAKVIEQARKKGGVLIFRGTNVVTGETRTIAVKVEQYTATVVSYEDYLPN